MHAPLHGRWGHIQPHFLNKPNIRHDYTMYKLYNVRISQKYIKKKLTDLFNLYAIAYSMKSCQSVQAAVSAKQAGCQSCQSKGKLQTKRTTQIDSCLVPDPFV